MAQDHIVTTGLTYFLFTYDRDRLVSARMVKLVDAFYWNEQIYLLLNDLLTEKIILRNHALNKDENRCQWKLFDVDTLRDILFAKDELKYSERTYHNNNDLLELDEK